MIKNIILGILILVSISVTGQIQTHVIGDSVLVHSNSSTGELILENSTKNVDGFLYNKGEGRTEFRKVMIKVNDSVYIFGGDTLRVKPAPYIASNGITLTGNDFQLSGPLIKATTLGVQNYALSMKTASGDSISYGSAGYGGTPSISSTDYMTHFSTGNYQIFQATGADTASSVPRLQFSLYNLGVFRRKSLYSGVIQAFAHSGDNANPAVDSNRNKPLLIITSGFNNNSGGGGDIILRPGVDGNNSNFITRYGNYSIRLEPSGTGAVKIARPPSGTSSDSLLVWNSADSSVKKVSQSSIGGGTPLVFSLHADATTNLTLTNQANAEQDLGNSNRTQRYGDLSAIKKARIITRVVTASASVNTPRLYLQYSTDGTTWSNLAQTGSPTISISSTGVKDTGWFTIATAAQIDNVYFRIAQNGGDGSADPAIGYLEIWLSK